LPTARAALSTPPSSRRKGWSSTVSSSPIVADLVHGVSGELLVDRAAAFVDVALGRLDGAPDHQCAVAGSYDAP